MLNQSASLQRRRLSVSGVVQGVGFRPFVYRLASALQVAGFVRNDGRGVTIEVQGSSVALDDFIARLRTDAPALARIDHCTIETLGITDDAHFVVCESEAGSLSASIPPDLATCDACLHELFDPTDRRYRYPFITCTSCGPRFTIVRALPYDRARTTMAAFPMCVACNREYHDPLDRRFHAETNACPVCGPRVRLLDELGDEITSDSYADAIAQAAEVIGSGAIVAIKGIGGFHLACRADSVACATRLRQRKQRDEKPFALIAPDLANLRQLVELDADEIRLLESAAHPIVLARRRLNAPVATNVARGRTELGVMLPYSPLHHILLRDAGRVLILTSGNRSDDPIVYDDATALDQLSGIADYFLVHNRPIHTRSDDSVVRVVTVAGTRQPLMLRRSRGYVPSTVLLPVASAVPVLACGAELKSTVTLVKRDRALVGPHLGDLENYETLQSFRDSIAQLKSLSGILPELVACDLHPEYLSTKFAVNNSEHAPEFVQHHHAHMAACLAEHGQCGPALGLIFDGSGFGTDGTIWGGELLVADLACGERIGHLWPVRMPGGTAAVREPWRMACAWLSSAGITERPATLDRHVSDVRWTAVRHLLNTGVASPVTTSMGRLLDAISAICGIRAFNSCEGQAAIELEAIARRDLHDSYPFPVDAGGERIVLDARALVRAVHHDAVAGRDCSEIAACAHNGVANAALLSLRFAAEQTGMRTVVLSGGVFQNVLLLERIAGALAAEGWQVLVPRVLPPNDGGISFGQAAVAAARARTSHPNTVRWTDVPGDTRTDPGHGGC